MPLVGVFGGPVTGSNPPAAFTFKPGQSGNPGGRPHGSSQRAVLLRKLAANPNEHGEGALAVERADALLKAVQDADEDKLNIALKFLAEVEPHPKESRTEITGGNGGPLRVMIEGIDDPEQPIAS